MQLNSLFIFHAVATTLFRLGSVLVPHPLIALFGWGTVVLNLVLAVGYAYVQFAGSGTA